MLLVDQKELQSRFFEELSNSLDISESEYQSTVESYEAVGNWLADKSSELHPYKPNIYPQGSFLLGTMIKPSHDDDELDIDLTCRLTGKKESWTQYNLKQVVGNRLKANKNYEEKLKKPDGRRCWTIKYSDSRKFHLDILPSIVDKNYEVILEKALTKFGSVDKNELAIRITDQLTDNYKTETNPDNWPKSNPFGFADWFNEQASLDIRKAIILESRIEPVPTFIKNKLPLQRVVQILKRHRDVLFKGDDEKPISIIITTLAAKAYQKETNLLNALITIVNSMESLIEDRYDSNLGRTLKWVANPVNDEENFADKWILEKSKQRKFYRWLENLKDDLNQALRKGDIQTFIQYLRPKFGERLVTEASNKLGISVNEGKSMQVKSSSFFDVPHRQKPIWPIVQNYNVTIEAKYIKDGGYYWSDLNGDILPKNCKIKFYS